jgi:hypothetical protein
LNLSEISTRYTTSAPVVVPKNPAHSNKLIKDSQQEGKEDLILPDSIRKKAERFGWSASVWLSKHLNGRQPVLLTRMVVPADSLSRRLNEQASACRQYQLSAPEK